MKLDIKSDGRRILLASLIGAGAALATAAILTMALALLVSTGRAGEGAERSMCVMTAFIATAVGALTARIKAKGAALLTGVGTSIMVILAKLLLMLISDESTAIDHTDLTIFLSILCAGVAVGAISIRRPRRRRR